MPTRDVTDDASNTDKASPTTTDKLLVVDVSTAPDSLKESTLQQIMNVWTSLTAKTTLTGADQIPIVDSAASNVAKNITWVNLVSAMSAFVPDGTMWNGKIAPTVSANDLVLTLQTASGGTPSATDPVYAKINGTVRTVTGALSVTVADGANSFNAGGAELATKLVGYFAYLGYRAASSAVVLGFARIPYATLYSDFSGTATNEKYGAFSTAPASTDDVVNIGYFEATLSAGAGYTWTVPTFTSANLIQKPTHETNWLYWAPAPTGFSAAPTDTVYIYKFDGKDIIARYREKTAGTSNLTTFTATAPFACATLTNLLMNFVGGGVDNNVNVAIVGQVNSGSNTITFFPNVQGSGSNTWTASGNKRIAYVQLQYPLVI